MVETDDRDGRSSPDATDPLEARRRLQAEKLAAVSEVVRALAHESRNALQRGQACLSMLRLRLRDQPELIALVDEAEEAQERLVELYEQVRGFAQAQDLRLQPVALDALVRSTWERTVPGSGHRLELDCENQDMRCRADPAVLGAALGALLDNAVESSPAGSTVWVEIARDEIEGSPAVSLTVRDEGPGLQDNVRERLFELFYTTKPGHAGLGLAHARKQIECHGGHLAALDSCESGARLRLVLPRAT